MATQSLSTVPSQRNDICSSGQYDKVQENWTVYSIGGGALAENNDNPTIESPDVYGMENMTEILQWCEDTGKSYWEYVKECEEEDIWDYLAEVWATMKDAIHRGLEAEAYCPVH